MALVSSRVGTKAKPEIFQTMTPVLTGEQEGLGVVHGIRVLERRMGRGSGIGFKINITFAKEFGMTRNTDTQRKTMPCN